MSSSVALNRSFSICALIAAGIVSMDSCAFQISWSFAPRWANIVPRLSTCTFTPSSNMSAAGAMMQSAWPAAASMARTLSEEPDSTQLWLTEPVRT